jgi:hypothetical protein
MLIFKDHSIGFHRGLIVIAPLKYRSDVLDFGAIPVPVHRFVMVLDLEL